MANGLINKELIMKAWTHLRKTEMTIPNETLDFMRDVALEKCAEMEACDWGMAETGKGQSNIPDVSESLPEEKPLGACLKEGCYKPQRNCGLCEEHYAEFAGNLKRQ